MAETIPKRIIQTGKSQNLPLLDRAGATNLRLLNPDFEYLFFDDAQVEEFVDSEFPHYRDVVDAFPARIQRYDLFRYLAVYRFGGFYFDTDMLLASPLDDLLQFGCVFPFEELGINRFLSRKYGMDWEIGNYAFGASAGHPFLGAIIENCVRAQRNPDWAEAMLRSIPHIFRREAYVLATTGPGLISRTLAEYPKAREQVTVLFSDDVCDQTTWHRFGDYGVHLQIGTWRRRNSMVRRVLERTWESRTRRALLKESQKRGSKRFLEFRPQ